MKEAVELTTKTSHVKFDASVELHVNLGVDPRQADQNIRTNLVLPQGTGRTVRVAVFADDKAEGADLSGIETITKQLEKGEINFDTLIATPANMAKLGKYARLLGPRGLMPNPKSGTVTTDVAKAVKEAKAGRVEFRVDSTGIVHLSVGKVSFGGAKLLENVNAVMNSIKAAKPQSIKGTYIKAIHLTTSMGPSIRVSLSE
jgi:large subunit ribosomal protein L1